MRWNILSWVVRCGSWILSWEKKKPAAARQQLRVLAYEHLDARVMLAAYYWDGTSNPWYSNHWYVNGVLQTWTDLDGQGNRNVANIQGASSSATITMTSGQQVSPSAIFIGDAAPTINYTITGGTIVLSAAITINVRQNTTCEIDSAISGSNYSLVKNGAGALIVGGTASVESFAVQLGTLQVDGQLEVTNAINSTNGLQIADPAVLHGIGTIALDTGAPLAYYSSATSSFSGQINGGGDLEMYNGLLSLSGANGYTGGTFLVSGTLNVNTDSALGAVPATEATNIAFLGNASLQAGAPSVTLSAKRDIAVDSGYSATFDDTAGAITVLGAITGLGSVTTVGSSALNLGGKNTYTGGTYANGPINLVAGSNGTLGATTGAGTGSVNIAAGVIVNLNGVATTIGSLFGYGEITDTSGSTSTTLTVDTNDVLPDPFPGLIAGPIHLVKTGADVLDLSGSNQFTARTEIDQGALEINADTALGNVPSPAATNITFGGNATLETSTSLSLDANRMIEVNAGVVATFDVLGSTTVLTIPGTIDGPGGIAKTGTAASANLLGSVLVLGGPNDYTGGTAVNNGEILLGAPQATLGMTTGARTGWVDIAAGATVDIYGVPTHIGPLFGSGTVTDSSSSASTPFIVDTNDNGGSQVDISSIFNIHGIYADGSTFPSNGGYDGAGTACSATLLGSSLDTGQGAVFAIGAPGANNVVSAAAQTITLTAGNYDGLTFLGSATSGIQTGTFTVNYSGGAYQTFTQTFSDWTQFPIGVTGQSLAIAPSYRNYYDGSKISGTTQLYQYTLPLDPTKTVASITLPNNSNIHLLAMDIAPDAFDGQIAGSVYLVKAGAAPFTMAGFGSFVGGLEIDAGTFRVGSLNAITTVTTLLMKGTAILDLNNFGSAIGSPIEFSTLNGDSGNVITNNGAPYGTGATLTVGGDANPNDSKFAGTIKDGSLNGTVKVVVVNGALTLTGTGNNYSGGTELDTSGLVLGDGLTNGMVTGAVSTSDEGYVTFNVVANSSTTFTGSITSDGYPSYVTKKGLGTLVVNSSYTGQQYSYKWLLLSGGTFTLGNAQAIPAGSNLTIDSGATLDLGGFSNAWPIYNVTINNGIAQNGTLVASHLIQAGYARIDASLAMASGFTPGLQKIQESGGPYSIPGVPDNTVVLSASSNSSAFTGSATVLFGTLQVDGSLGSSPVSVQSGAALGGSGTCAGAVSVGNGGILALDESLGSTFTMTALNLQSGSTVKEYVQFGQLELAKVTGQLTVGKTNGVGVTIAFPNQAGNPFASFQRLIAYGSIYDGGFNNLAVSGAPGGASLFQDTIAKNIDLAQETVLYWADGSEPWDPSYATQWENASTQQTQAWMGGAVAVFAGAGAYSIPVDFAATPSAMIFASGTYTIGVSGTGTISMPGNALVSVGSGTATISAPLSASGTTHTAIVDLQSGKLVLNGNDSGVGNITVFSEAAGTLQLGDGSSSNTLPAAQSGDSIAFDQGLGSTAAGSLVFQPPSTTTAVSPQVFAGTIGGNFAVVVNGGSGATKFTASSTYLAGTTIAGGATLVVTSASCFGSASAPITLNNGTLQVTAIVDLTAPITLGAGGGTVDTNGHTVDFEKPVDGAGGITVTDTSGTNTGVLFVSGKNTYSAGTTVYGGTFYANSTQAIPDNMAISVGQGGNWIYDPNAAAATLSSGGGTPPGAGGTPTLSAPPPTVSAIQRADGETLVDADSVKFTVTFSTAVTHVTTDDFVIDADGPTGTVTAVRGYGANYTVTVSGITGAGSLGLVVADDDTITDTNGAPLASSTTVAVNQRYVISRDLFWAGGSAMWSGGHWRVGSMAGPLQGWCDGSNAFFAGVPGMISVVCPVTVGSLTFLSDGYVIEGGAISLDASPAGSNTPSPPAPLPSTGEGSGLPSTPGSLPSIGEGRLINVAVGAATIDCEISGDALVKTGGGTLVLGGTNTYADSITVSQGVLKISGSSAVPAGTAIVVNGGVFDLDGNVAECTTVTLDGGSIVDGGLEVDGALNLYSGTVLADIGGTAALDKLGSGTVVLAGHDTYQGGTSVLDGVLVAMRDDSLPSPTTGTGTVIVQPTLYWSGSGDWATGPWQLADGTPMRWIDGSHAVVAAGSDIHISGTVHVGAITVEGNATIEGGALVLPAWSATISVASGTATIDSAISGGGLAETGTGTLLLDGTLTYTGPTTVAGGTLDLMSALAAPPVIAGGRAIGPGALFSADNMPLSDLDPALFSLVQSLFVDQAIDRADMIQILQIAVVDGGVSDDALAALETITAPQNEARLNMPDYVAVLANDVVGGNPANARYQGQPQGNLAEQGTAGGTPTLRATVLGELVDKWFFGGDLPAVPANVSYGIVAGSLFGDDPNQALNVPSSADMQQGSLGDCYFIAALGALADASPAAIENMIISNGVENGVASWTVRFYYRDLARGYVADYVTVSALLPGRNGNLCYDQLGPAGRWWLPLVEKAYAEWNETGHEGRDGQNSYASLYGGLMQVVDAQVLGRPATNCYPASDPTAKQSLIAAIQTHAAVTAAIFAGQDAADFARLGLVSCHAYMVDGYDADPASPTFDTFLLKNPWGYHEPSRLTWDDLRAYCWWITVAEAPSAVVANSPAAGVPGQAGRAAALQAVAGRQCIPDAACLADIAGHGVAPAMDNTPDTRARALALVLAKSGL